MPIQETNPSGAQAMLAGPEPWTLVDVRTPEEFAAGHAPGAFNVPVALRGPYGMQLNPGFVAVVRRHFGAGDKLLLTCAAGARSRHACEMLAAEGFTALANLNGGMHGGPDASGTRVEPGWQSLGLPVTREPLAGRSWPELAKG